MITPLPLRIAGVGVALPECVLRSEELDARFGFAPGTIAERTGVHERRRAAPGDSNATLGAAAIRAALAHAGHTPDALDLVLNASGTQQQLIPDGGPLMQRALGPGMLGVPAFSIHATCLGFVVALHTAAALLAAGSYRRIAIVTSEVSSRGVDWNEWESAALMGDAAAAVVVERPGAGDAAAIEAWRMETWSDGVEAAQIVAGGTACPAGTPDTPLEKYRFQMDGQRLLRLGAGRLRAFLDALDPDLLARAGAVDWVVPHQPSVAGLRLLERVGWPAERTCMTLDRYGNCVAASIPLTFAHAVLDARIRRGDRVLLVGTGAGMSFGGLVLRY